MPTPRQYATGADRQAAYRARQAEARERERAAKGLPAAPAVATMPGTARWAALLRQAHAALVTVQDEMQSYMDERSDAWQEGERAEAMQARLDTIAEAAAALEDLEVL